MVTLIDVDGDKLLFGCDTEADVANLPKTMKDLEAFGCGYMKVRPWSLALVGNGDVYFFKGDNSTWTKIGV